MIQLARRKLKALASRGARVFRKVIGQRAPRPPEPEFREFRDYDTYARYRSESREVEIERARVAHGCIREADSFYIQGYCDPCERRVDLLVDFLYTTEQEAREPNWRERLVCPCGLNNRVRAAIHVFRRLCKPKRDDPIYLMEQVTPLYRWLVQEYRNVVGSEYLGGSIPFGTTRTDGVRNESVTQLTFADGTFAHALSFDVLEHVPAYERALRELARVLREGGHLLFSVPFVPSSRETLVRARVALDGSIEHLLAPEYHGDPMADEGCLCFYHFGWDLLDSCRRAGFSDVRAIAVWSREFGYLGGEQILFLAKK